MLVIFRPLQFCYQMLCPRWDPTVFLTVEYVLAEVSRKVYDYRLCCYRLCLNIKTLNHEDSILYSALMYPLYIKAL